MSNTSCAPDSTAGLPDGYQACGGDALPTVIFAN